MGSTVALSQMKRQPARFPSARQSSSSAEVWWISSTITVSRPVMRSSWNHRRAIPVVTMTTFQPGRLRRRLALAVHDSDLERRLENGLRDGTDAQRLAGAGAGDDAEALARDAPSRGTPPRAPARARSRDGAERELDRLARGAGGRDDDDAAAGVRRVAIRVGVGGEMVIAGGAHGQEEKGGRTGLSP